MTPGFVRPGVLTPLNGGPAGYFLTWTCFGTWLHGDSRGSIDRDHRALQTPPVTPNEARLVSAQRRMKSPPFALDAARRSQVESAIVYVCERAGWRIHALNVRTNHVHAVVTTDGKPEQALTAFKGWATRQMHGADIVEIGTRVWTKGGSTRYLWTERDIEAAVTYVLEGQGPALPGAGRWTLRSAEARGGDGQ
jgi:REP element-mobilizing transposase RayT